MQRYLSLLLVMMLYLASSNSSAQQFDNFRYASETSGVAAGTVTSITLAPTTSQISYFDAAGLSTVYDVIFTPSKVIRKGLPVFMPQADFGDTLESMNLSGVGFYTGTLVNTQDRQGAVPAHWFRITYHDGIWSGAFRIADRIYAIDRSQRDNVVTVRDTPSLNTRLQPTRQIKITALLDDAFVYADSPGDSLGMDNLGHIHALESLHILDGVMNDSLGMTMRLEQLVYQPSAELASPSLWIANNADAFGIDDNYATFIFSGDAANDTTAGNNYVMQGKSRFTQLSTAHNFGKLLGIPEEEGTLQNNANSQVAAHWSDSQKQYAIANLPNANLVQITSSDAPPIEITEPEQINQIPQHILDSESVESSDGNTGDVNTTEPDTGNGTETGSQNPSGNNAPGLQNDDAQAGFTNDSSTSADATSGGGGGGNFGPISVISLLTTIALLRRKRIF